MIDKTLAGRNISFIGFWGVNKLFGLGQTKAEVRENIRECYSDEANPSARYAALQTNALIIGISGVALGMLTGILALVFGFQYSELMIWFITVLPLPLVILSTYFYVRLIPIDKEATNWEEGEQPDTVYAKKSHMFYDIEYYLGFVISLVLSVMFVPMILNA